MTRKTGIVYMYKYEGEQKTFYYIAVTFQRNLLTKNAYTTPQQPQ